MLHALLHGKLAESNPEPQRLEDALTSTVFGAIFWAEDWKLLEKWLGIPPSSSQRAPIIEYWFWPRLAEAEPDVVFRLGNALVVVEAKYRSDRHDLALKSEEDESVGDQLVRQYRSIARPVSERAQYAEGIECAIRDCQLIQLYVVDARRQPRARREVEESKRRLPPNATLNLVTWQSLSQVLNVNYAVNQGWRSDLAGYLRHCGLDIFSGFSRLHAPEGQLFQIRDWSMRIAYPKLRFQSAFKPESVQPAMLLRWKPAGGEAGLGLRRAFSHELLEGTAQRVILSWRSQAYSSIRTTHPMLQFQRAFKPESVQPAMLLRWNLPGGVAEFNLRRAFRHELLEGTAQPAILSWRSQA
jgi:hypothetical protein